MLSLGKAYSDVLDDDSVHHIFDTSLIDKNFIKDSFYKNITERFKQIDGTIFLSLSGGVDSSVLAFIGNQFCLENRKKLVCLHMDYGNREESVREREFIIKYCDILNIECRVYIFDGPKRGEINRGEYEKMTTDKRYNEYKNIIDELGCEGVVLGHHKDDMVENIFTNIMKGRDINDLSVIDFKSTVHGVKVIRPLIDFYKKDVFAFAHKYGVPYFKNTTPSWSIRGQMREIVFPQLQKMFNRFEQNLINFNDSIEQQTECLNKNVFDSFIKNIIKNDKELILEKVDQNRYFWKTVIMRVLHGEGIKMLSESSFNLFFEALSKTKKRLDFKNIRIDIEENIVIIIVK